MNTQRLRNGRFATAIESERDRAKCKIAHLSLEAEKWYRAYEVLAESNARLERENAELKKENQLLTKIKNLLQ